MQRSPLKETWLKIRFVLSVGKDQRLKWNGQKVFLMEALSPGAGTLIVVFALR